MGGVIVAWLVYSGTGSAYAITALGVVEFLPTLTFGIFAGALIDRYDRRSLMILADAVRAALVLALAGYLWLFGLNLVVVLAAILGVATFSAVFRPASNALLPKLVGRAELPDGNGLLLAGTTAAQLVGSPLGGVVLIAAGSTVGLAYNSVTFALSAVLLAAIAIPMAGASDTASPTSLWSEVREGMRFLRSQNALLWITLTAMAANFFLGMYATYAVIYASTQLHAGPAVFGILLGANAAGFGIGAVLVGRLHVDHRAGLAFSISWGSSGVAILLLALVYSVPVAILLVAASAILGGFGNTVWLSAVQQTVPDRFLGRYFSLDEAGSFAMIPLGQIAGGILITWHGISFAYAVGGIGSALASFSLLLHPGARAWGAPRGPSAASERRPDRPGA
jgi:predicted MFS family arabinose efflux permease